MHLEAGQDAAVDELRDGCGKRPGEVGGLAGQHQGVQAGEGRGGVFLDGGEGCDVGGVLRGEASGEGEMPVGGVEGVPDGVGEGCGGHGHQSLVKASNHHGILRKAGRFRTRPSQVAIQL